MADDPIRRPGDARGLPAQIGRYKVVSRIGKGAMGVVYHAHDELMDRAVAIKVLTADLASDPSIRTRFYREAKVAGQLVHPNIITVFDMGEEAGRLYIVMELLQGHTLGEYLRERPGLPLTDRLDIMTQVCSGMAAAHARGIVHRDLKPSNLFVLSDGVVKVLDFGVARLADSNVTAAGLIIGTPDYMSPEQARGDPIDHRADIFSGGAVFYYLLTGKRPFVASDLPSLLHKVEHDDPPPLSEQDAPPALAAIVMKALRKDRTQRYQSFNDLLTDVLRFHKTYEQQGRRSLQAARSAYQDAARHAAAFDAHATALGLEALGAREMTALLARYPLLDEAVAVDPRGLDPQQLPQMVSEVERVRDELVDSVRLAGEMVAHQQAAEAALSAGHLDAAERELDLVLDRAPTAARCLSLRQQIETARTEVASRARQEAELVEAGRQAVARGDWGEAQAACDRLLEVNPQSAEAERLRQAAAVGQQHEAEEALAAEARRVIAWAHDQAQAGRPEAGVEALANLMGRAPAAPGVETALAALRAQVADREAAARRREQAEAALQEARAALEAGNPTAAVAAIDRALSLDPSHEAAAALGVQARSALREAEARAAREAQVLAHLTRARSHLARGRFDRARREVTSALVLDPASPAAQQLSLDIARAEATAPPARPNPITAWLSAVPRRWQVAALAGTALVVATMVGGMLWRSGRMPEAAPSRDTGSPGAEVSVSRPESPDAMAPADRTTPAATATDLASPADTSPPAQTAPGAAPTDGAAPSPEEVPVQVVLPRLAQGPDESREAWMQRRRDALAAFERAQADLARRRPAEALAAFESIAASSPDYPGIQDRIDTARRALAAANRALAQRLFSEGQQLESDGDLLGGMQKYRAARQADADLPQLAERIAVLERLLIARGERLIGEAESEATRDPAAAIRRYEEALQYLPEGHAKVPGVRRELQRLRAMVG